MKKFISFLIVIGLSVFGFAQEPELTLGLRDDGSLKVDVPLGALSVQVDGDKAFKVKITDETGIEGAITVLQKKVGGQFEERTSGSLSATVDFINQENGGLSRLTLKVRKGDLESGEVDLRVKLGEIVLGTTIETEKEKTIEPGEFPYALEQAIILEQVLAAGEYEKAAVILTMFYPKEDPSLEKVKEYYERYGIVLSASESHDTTLAQAVEGASAQSAAFASGLGGTDVTNFALGLSNFLIDRAKTELNTAFFKRFKDQIESSDLRLLFPSTHKLLSVIDEEIYQYDHYLNNLRDAFKKDLSALIENIPAYADEKKTALDEIDPMIVPMIKLGAGIVEEVRSGNHPVEMIDRISTMPSVAEAINVASPSIGSSDEAGKKARAYTNALNGMRLAGVISESLRSSEDKTGWLDESKLNKLKDPEVLKLYLILLGARTEGAETQDIKFLTSTGSGIPASQSFFEMFKMVSDEPWNDPAVIEVRTFVSDFASHARQCNQAFNSYKKLKESLDEAEDLKLKEKNQQLAGGLYDIYEHALNMMMEVCEHGSEFGFDVLEKPCEKLAFADNFIELGLALVTEEYSDAVTSATFILDYMLDNMPCASPTVTNFIRYGAFMANLVQAENEEAVQKAIEAVALPPGSYSIKRERNFSVALNGYLGTMYGSSQVVNADDMISNNLFVTAPVGLSISFGNFPRRWKNPFSVGLNVPVIDVGAIVAYQLDSMNTTANETEIRYQPKIFLDQIIAPGLFLEVGIPGTPLTLGGGMQFSPLAQSQPEVPFMERGTRYGVTLKVDIPIIHFGGGTSSQAHCNCDPVIACKKLEKHRAEMDKLSPEDNTKLKKLREELVLLEQTPKKARGKNAICKKKKEIKEVLKGTKNRTKKKKRRELIDELR